MRNLNFTQYEYTKRCNEYEKKIRKYESLLPLTIFFAVFFERLAEESIFERQAFYWVLFFVFLLWSMFLFGWFKKEVEDLNYFRGECSNGEFLR
jgi:hypothetical protein